MRRPLIASIPDDDGSREASVQWLDYEVLHLLTRDRLPEGYPVRLYVELPPQNRLVELVLEIQDITRPSATSTRGWLHRARWSAAQAEHGAYLESQMTAINPAARKPTRWAQRSRGELSSSVSRSAAHSRRSMSSLGSGSRGEMVTGPVTNLAEGEAGGPPNLLVRFLDADQIGQCIEIEDDGFWLRLDLEATLPIGGQILVALQLPEHQFIQALACIETSRGRFYELRARLASSTDIVILRRALGDSDSVSWERG